MWTGRCTEGEGDVVVGDGGWLWLLYVLTYLPPLGAVMVAVNDDNDLLLINQLIIGGAHCLLVIGGRWAWPKGRWRLPGRGSGLRRLVLESIGAWAVGERSRMLRALDVWRCRQIGLKQVRCL